ncbi:MAG: hypothetical protein ACFFC7_31255 [Candidatus Hermodarchaeota archaeon]
MSNENRVKYEKDPQVHRIRFDITLNNWDWRYLVLDHVFRNKIFIRCNESCTYQFGRHY